MPAVGRPIQYVTRFSFQRRGVVEKLFVVEAVREVFPPPKELFPPDPHPLRTFDEEHEAVGMSWMKPEWSFLVVSQPQDRLGVLSGDPHQLVQAPQEPTDAEPQHRVVRLEIVDDQSEPLPVQLP